MRQSGGKASRSVEGVARLDTERRLAFLPLDAAECAELLPGTTEDERGESWHLVTATGEDLTGGVGLIAIAETLKATRWIGRTVRLLRLAPVLDVLDNGLKRARPKLGKLIPDKPGPVRFP